MRYKVQADQKSRSILVIEDMKEGSKSFAKAEGKAKKLAIKKGFTYTPKIDY